MADDTNSMQGSLGLGYGPPQPVATPTMPVSMPVTKHPGEASVELAHQTDTQAVQTRTTVTALSNPVATPPPGVPQAYANFGSQYAMAHAAITGNYMGGYGASMYGPMPVPGLNTALMPMAGGLTDPAYGIYRTRVPGFSGFNAFPTIPREPMLRSPFYQGLPEQMYTSPAGFADDLGNVRAAQYQGAVTAALGTVTRMGVGIAGNVIGSSLGAAAGGYLGGATGARIGSFIGGIGGGMLADTVVGDAAQKALESNPLTNVAQRAAQIQGITTGFVTTGADVGSQGRGLGYGSALDVARFIQRQGYAETSGFNAADLMKIVDQGGKAGLLDNAQSVTDIKSKVMNVASVLRQFMQITNDPDVTSAIKELGNMRSLGISVNEAASAAQNMRAYAKMAGTSAQALNAVGQAGAYTFQMQGLSPGLGMQVGGAAMGSARQAVASGTYTDEQLAMQGGVAGIAQRSMEASAAMLKTPMLISAMSRMQDNGTFGLDPESVKKLMAGNLSAIDLGEMSARNIAEATNKRGAGAIGMYKMQENELQSQLGKALGPTGTEMMQFNFVKNLMRDMGMESTPENFATAAGVMFKGDPQRVRDVVQMASNPDYFKAKVQALEQEQVERGSEMFVKEGALEKARTPPLDIYRRTIQPIKDYFNRSDMGGLIDDISRTITEGTKDMTDTGVGKYNFHAGALSMPENALQREVVMTPPKTAGAGGMYGNMVSPGLRLAAQGKGEMGLFDVEAMAAFTRRKSGRATSGFMGLVESAADMKHNVDTAEYLSKAKEFDAGAAAMGDIYDTTPEQAADARRRLLAAYGGDEAKLVEAQQAYAHNFKAVADSKGESLLHRFTGFGQGAQAATKGDIDTLDSGFNDPKIGQLMRQSMGAQLTQGVNNPAFMNRETSSSAYMAQVFNAMDNAQGDARDELSGSIFGVAAQSRHTGALSAAFLENADADVAAMSGLIGLATTGSDAEKQRATAAMYRYQSERGIRPGDEKYNQALELAQKIAKTPEGDLSLREMGGVVSSTDPSTAQALYQGVGDQLRANARYSMEVRGLWNTVRTQARPEDQDALLQGLIYNGTQGLADAAISRGGRVFNDGSGGAAALGAYQEAINNGQDRQKAYEQLQNSLGALGTPSKDGAASAYRSEAVSAAIDSASRTGANMAGIFPDAVNTLKASAEEMSRAAIAIQRTMGRARGSSSPQMSFGP